MRTLALINGDLSINPDGSYLLYNGAARIRQDLQLALSEEYGTDRFHPTFGSIVRSYLGNPISAQTEQLVRAEVNRIIQNYIVLQQNEVIQDTVVDVAGRFDTSDVVRNVEKVEAKTLLDAIYIHATLITLARKTVTISKQVV